MSKIGQRFKDFQQMGPEAGKLICELERDRREDDFISLLFNESREQQKLAPSLRAAKHISAKLCDGRFSAPGDPVQPIHGDQGCLSHSPRWLATLAAVSLSSTIGGASESIQHPEPCAS